MIAELCIHEFAPKYAEQLLREMLEFLDKKKKEFVDNINLMRGLCLGKPLMTSFN